jgi:hypothetical protein
MPSVKIRLKSGIREIELEGEYREVDALLEKWWKPSHGTDNEEADGDPLDEAPRKPKLTKKRGRSGKRAVGGEAAPTDPDRDPNKIANAVKQSKDFARIQERVILGESTVYDKVAFICWFVEKPLTSGDISRALLALNMKVGVSRVSTELKRNIGNFITSAQRVAGGPPADYKLTEKAKSDFEKWFKANAK